MIRVIVNPLSSPSPGLCVQGSVHLANGYTATEGRLEMCINGSWTTFYGYLSWDTYAPNITCRQIFGSTACKELGTALVRWYMLS